MGVAKKSLTKFMKKSRTETWSRVIAFAALPPILVVSRVLFGGFIFLTAFYCLLFYVPFTRHALFGWNVVPALSVFARYHAILYWLAVLPVGLSFLPNLAEPRLRRPTMGFIVAMIAVGIGISLSPLLANLPPDERTLIWALVSLFPLWWIAALDWPNRATAPATTTRSSDRLGPAEVVAIAACVSCIYLLVFAIRYVANQKSSFSATELLLFALFSLGSHLFLFGVVFAAFKSAGGLSQKLLRSPKLGIIVRSVMVALVLTLVLRKVVFTAISFNGGIADLSAILCASSFVAYAAASILRFRSLRSTSRLQRFHTAFQLVKTTRLRWIAGAISILFISLFANFTLVNLQGVDWHGLLQRTSVLLTWLAVFAVFRALRQPQPDRQPSLPVLVLMGLITVGLYFGFQVGRPALSKLLQRRAPAMILLLERYAEHDPSFAVTSEILAPTTVDVFEGSAADPFFAMLRQNTNIPPDVHVPAVDIKLVDTLQASSGRKPHVFVFVVDSLRKDYLSPYNRNVRFTPAIESFASESFVMKNAFTRYGGTALAVSSIWSGGMQLHQQFGGSFYPRNSLQKLIETHGYRAHLTVDPVLKSLWRSSNEIVELDKGVDWKEYDMVQTLSELKIQLSQARPVNEPIFVYSQPQNLHLVSLHRSKRRPSENENYEGFATQHAFEVERIDSAFGDFVQFLKLNQLYDESIIILTADHGDALGEEGHWGHGSSIYPEVIRIPLIVHLPESLKRQVVCDANTIAFSTDITPSLYYLLGHHPLKNDHLFGRPLFTATLPEQQAYLRDSYLIADSYGPVYGILRDQGRTLFVADGTRNQAYLYDLTQGYGGKRINISDELADEYKNAITFELKRIQAFYNFQPAEKIAAGQSQPGTIAQLYSLLFSH